MTLHEYMGALRILIDSLALCSYPGFLLPDGDRKGYEMKVQRWRDEQRLKFNMACSLLCCTKAA